MLVGISPLLSPELLSTLYRMGHRDQIVLADAHFSGETLNLFENSRTSGRYSPLIPPDTYVECSIMMITAVPGDSLDANEENSYMNRILMHWQDHNKYFTVQLKNLLFVLKK